MKLNEPAIKKVFNDALREAQLFFNGTHAICIASKDDDFAEIMATSDKIATNKLKSTEFTINKTEFKQLTYDGFKYLSEIQACFINKSDPLSLIPELEMETLVLGLSLSSSVNAKIYIVGTKEAPLNIPSNIKSIKYFRNIIYLALENYLLYKNMDLKQKISQPHHIFKKKLIGESHSIKEINKMIELVAKGTSTVLIRGESGTGKEIVAQMIHYYSERKMEPFVRINCAAIPENLLESELFGHEKGSFTGAVARRIGKFEQANNGAIFLDEIGEVPSFIQVKLLNFLQEREFARVGSNELIKVNVRIIAATNRNLEKAIREGQFREDLYYRLNVMPLVIPPLKERLQDIGELVNHFISQFNEELNLRYKSLSSEALFLLEKYHYPGNIRELENIIERAMVIGDGKTVTPQNLPKEIFGLLPQMREDQPSFSYREKKSSLWEVERGIIDRALSECNFNQSKAARELGITRNQLRYRIKKYDFAISKHAEN